MKEELLKRLVACFDGVERYLKESEGFVKAQAPDVLKEMITRGYIANSFGCAAAISLIVIGLAKALVIGGDYSEWFWILAICGKVWLWASAEQLVNIRFTPKLYLLESIKKLLSPDEKESQ